MTTRSGGADGGPVWLLSSRNVNRSEVNFVTKVSNRPVKTLQFALDIYCNIVFEIPMNGLGSLFARW